VLAALAAAVLFLTGIWWGVPAHGTWAPDELTPEEIRFAASVRFSGGWATIYPPLHYVLLAVVYWPVEALARAVLHLDPLQASGLLTLASRSISCVMALGILAAVYRTVREAAGDRAALLAASIAGVSLPLTYYAKTVNLDVPYTFWLAVALFFYARTFRSDRAQHFYGFALAGMAAIATKDQAYGFFVLPAVYMAAGALFVRLSARSLPGVPAPPVLLRMALISIAAFVVFFNLPFNAEGFAEHVRLIVGPASADYRMFPPGAAGQGPLARAAALQLGSAMSWPLAVACAVAVAAAFARRDAATVHLLLPAVSYYVCFIAVVGYVYDRFLLGVVVNLAIAAGPWLALWMRRGDSVRRWRAALLAAMVVYAAARCVSLDYLMVRDSRYGVERWVQARAGEATIAAVGRPEYLPRTWLVPWRPLHPSLDDLEAIDPEIVVVNASYARRFEPGTPGGAFFAALRTGAAGYRLVRAFRTPRALLPLGLEPRFRQVAEDQFSNLAKVDPLMEIYVRVSPRR